VPRSACPLQMTLCDGRSMQPVAAGTTGVVLRTRRARGAPPTTSRLDLPCGSRWVTQVEGTHSNWENIPSICTGTRLSPNYAMLLSLSLSAPTLLVPPRDRRKSAHAATMPPTKKSFCPADRPAAPEVKAGDVVFSFSLLAAGVLATSTGTVMSRFSSALTGSATPYKS
jgi:hypothetical protein